MRYVIKIQKGERCPICRLKMARPNAWVKFHIKYRPEMTILACKFCNFTEWALRNQIPLKSRAVRSRIPAMVLYMKKFDIQL